MPVFTPRTDRWSEHVRWLGIALSRRTPTGRAMIEGLRLDRPVVLRIRHEELLQGRNPQSPHFRGVK
jgi:hypothetical protein